MLVHGWPEDKTHARNPGSDANAPRRDAPQPPLMRDTASCQCSFLAESLCQVFHNIFLAKSMQHIIARYDIARQQASRPQRTVALQCSVWALYSS